MRTLDGAAWPPPRYARACVRLAQTLSRQNPGIPIHGHQAHPCMGRGMTGEVLCTGVRHRTWVFLQMVDHRHHVESTHQRGAVARLWAMLFSIDLSRARRAGRRASSSAAPIQEGGAGLPFILKAAARKSCRFVRLQLGPLHAGLPPAHGSGVAVRLRAQHREIEISLASQVFSESLARNALAAGSAQRLRNTA